MELPKFRSDAEMMSGSRSTSMANAMMDAQIRPQTKKHEAYKYRTDIQPYNMEKERAAAMADYLVPMALTDAAGTVLEAFEKVDIAHQNQQSALAASEYGQRVSALAADEEMNGGMVVDPKTGEQRWESSLDRYEEQREIIMDEVREKYKFSRRRNETDFTLRTSATDHNNRTVLTKAVNDHKISRAKADGLRVLDTLGNPEAKMEHVRQMYYDGLMDDKERDGYIFSFSSESIKNGYVSGLPEASLDNIADFRKQIEDGKLPEQDKLTGADIDELNRASYRAVANRHFGILEMNSQANPEGVTELWAYYDQALQTPPELLGAKDLAEKNQLLDEMRNYISNTTTRVKEQKAATEKELADNRRITDVRTRWQDWQNGSGQPITFIGKGSSAEGNNEDALSRALADSLYDKDGQPVAGLPPYETITALALQPRNQEVVQNFIKFSNGHVDQHITNQVEGMLVSSESARAYEGYLHYQWLSTVSPSFKDDLSTEARDSIAIFRTFGNSPMGAKYHELFQQNRNNDSNGRVKAFNEKVNASDSNFSKEIINQQIRTFIADRTRYSPDEIPGADGIGFAAMQQDIIDMTALQVGRGHEPEVALNRAMEDMVGIWASRERDGKVFWERNSIYAGEANTAQVDALVNKTLQETGNYMDLRGNTYDHTNVDILPTMTEDGLRVWALFYQGQPLADQSGQIVHVSKQDDAFQLSQEEFVAQEKQFRLGSDLVNDHKHIIEGSTPLGRAFYGAWMVAIGAPVVGGVYEGAKALMPPDELPEFMGANVGIGVGPQGQPTVNAPLEMRQRSFVETLNNYKAELAKTMPPERLPEANAAVETFLRKFFNVEITDEVPGER